jgi:ankyrin repeat protein
MKLSKFLLKYRAKADTITKKVGTALHCSILSVGDNTATIVALMDAGALLPTQATLNTRWLHVICGWDGDDRIRMCPPQQVDGCILHDATPAFVAVRSFQGHLLKTLLPPDLNHVFQIRFRDAKGETKSTSTIPCMRELQALEKVFKTFKLLRHTYLSSCATNGDLDGVKLLIAKGANLNLDHETAIVPLVTAARFAHTDIAMLLLESGASVDRTDNESRTALHYAAFIGALDIVRLLCERGANPDTTVDNGYTALHCAASSNEATDSHRQVISTLCECGATVDAQTNDDVTALHVAAEQGSHELTCLLCERGATTGMKDNDG